ncbi:MAG: 8-amino-7-oxononanoate synthase [Lysobacteraceae bacterium]
MSEIPSPRQPRASLTARIAAARRESGPAQTRRELSAREGVRVLLDGRELRNFCSNDYLGLAQHPEVVSSLQESAAWRGVGSSASPWGIGRFREHRELEDAIAQWQQYPAALLFGSGHAANLGVQQALLREGDLCVQDKLNQSSLFDGAKLAGAELKHYPHLLVDAALKQLRSRPQAAAMLATDGVFGMDGDLAPLKLLAVLARTEDATFYVDDAHGAGVIGPDGSGSVAHAGLSVKEVPLQLIALGKALGGYGAVLLGQPDLIAQVADSARSSLHITAPPPALAAASLSALKLARKENWRRFKLAALVARFRRGGQQLGIPLLDSTTAIQPVMVGDADTALAAAKELETAGFLVSAIRPPIVPENRARLRITLSAAHNEADIDALLEALATALKKVRAPA